MRRLGLSGPAILMASWVIGDLGIDRVGVVYQDDSFGQAGLSRGSPRP